MQAAAVAICASVYAADNELCANGILAASFDALSSVHQLPSARRNSRPA